MLRAHLYMMDAQKEVNAEGVVSQVARDKSMRRAVLDYDYVVNEFKPTVARVEKRDEFGLMPTTTGIT